MKSYAGNSKQSMQNKNQEHPSAANSGQTLLSQFDSQRPHKFALSSANKKEISQAAGEQTSRGVFGKRASQLAIAAIALAGFTSRDAKAAVNDELGKDPFPAGHNAPAPESDGQTRAAQLVHDFKIPAGSLTEVANAFEKETGVRLIVPTDKIGEISSPGASGVLTLEEALKKALANTGVSARFETDDRVILELRGNNESVVVNGEGLNSPKYTAPLSDLPRTITIVPEEIIQNSGSTSLVEVLRTVPGITFGAGEGGNPVGDRPFIRGLDSQASTYVDGIRDIGAQSREVFNVESVEVSEGPSGSYGGRGAAGGSLNLNNKVARRDSFLAGNFIPGSAAFRRGTVDGNLKISNLVSGRLNGLWHDADVAGRDGVHDNRWGVAPSLAFGLASPTRAYISYYHLVSDSMPDSGIPYNNPTFVARTDGRPRVLQAGDGSPLKLPHRRIFYGLLDRDKRLETNKSATGRVERDLGSERQVLRNTFRYGRTSQDYILTQPDDSKGNIYYGLLWRRTNNRVSSVYSAVNQTDLSGQFATGKIKHVYAAGLEFSQERGNNDSYTIATGTNTCPSGAGAASGYNCTDLFAPNMRDPWAGSIKRNYNPTNSKTVSKSLYGFDTIAFHPRFQSTLGLRYDNYSSSFLSTATNGVRTKYSREDNLVNYDVGVVYKPVHSGSLYASVNSAAIPTGNALAQGSDSSALNSAINANLEPMKIRAEEAGVKWELSGGRALAKADFFRSDINNARITQADGTIAMAGVQRILGAEVGVTGQLTKKLQLYTGYIWMDATLVKAGGSGVANGLQDGTKFPNTPEHSYSLTSYYRVLPKLNVGGGIYAMSKVWGSQVNNKWVPSYVRGDLFGSYEFNKHLDLQVNVQNVGDALYFDKAYPTHYASMAPGRFARAGFNVKF